MNWYSLLKKADYPEGRKPYVRPYVDLGHGGYSRTDSSSEFRRYGCNHLWGMDYYGNYKVVAESAEMRRHDLTHSGIDLAYQGRIDTCKKEASILNTCNCSDKEYFKNQSVCEKLKFQSLENIHKQFGKDINIVDFTR